MACVIHLTAIDQSDCSVIHLAATVSKNATDDVTFEKDFYACVRMSRPCNANASSEFSSLR